MVVGQLEIQLMAQTARLVSDMDRAQRTVSGAVKKINNVLGAIGVGISVDFLLGLATKANEYSKSLAALSTQISGATNQIKELDAASRNLSVQFGTPAIKQSAAFYEILSAGITDTTQATALLTEANRLAIGGNADLMISVDGLTSIIKGYGSAAGTAAEISDTMFTASLAGKLSIQELSESIGKVIPLATTMGVSLEEVTSAISALTLGGISAKESVTGVRAILAAVAKPSSEAARLAKEIGLEFNSASVQANGFAKFMEDVKSKTKGSSDQMAILFGGVESLIPALALTGNAGVEFNNILGQMANKAGATEEAFNKMANSPGFKFDKFMATLSNIAITLGDALANVLTPAAELAAKALNKLFGFNNVSGIEKQVQLVNQLTEKVESMANRKNIPLVGGLLFDKKEFDLLEHQLEMAKVDLESMKKAQETVSVVQKQSTVEVIKNTVEIQRNNEKKEQAVKASTRLAKSFDIELHKLKEYEQDAKRARDITDSVATEQEIYNKKLDELNRLKPYLSVETYERALAKLNTTTKQTAVVTRTATDEVSQLWIQAGRNIQSALANSIFNFFDDGLKGMVSNVVSAVGRIGSEFTALKIAQMTGLNQMFGMGGVGGTGSPVSMDFSGGMTLASMFGKNPSQAAAENFALKAWGNSGASSASTGMMGRLSTGMAGASVPGMLGAAGILAASVGMGSSIAGDKKIFGIDGTTASIMGAAMGGPVGAVVAGAINALFGRSPYKFRQQSLQGTASAEGFEGDFTNVFRSKGGVFSGNKHKSFSQAFTQEQQDLFDTALNGFYASTRGFAKNLGFNVDLVDGFTKEFQIKSEKNQQLTSEAIEEMLSGFGNDLARNVLPNIDEFRKTGEDAIATLGRLSNEFSALDQAAVNLGASAAYAKELVSNLSLQTRSNYVEAAGGADQLLELTSKFSQNFLTDAERIAPAIKFVEDGLTGLGISSDISKDAFGDLIQTLIQSASDADKATALLLLQNQDIFLSVNSYKESLKQVTTTTDTLAESERSLNDIRQELLSSYNKELGELESTIDKFKNIASSLRDFKNSLVLGQLSPLTPAQRLEEARTQFNRTRMLAGQGDQSALQSLPEVSQAFLQASQTYNASSAAYLSDFNLVKNVLDSASQSAISQYEIAQTQLDKLKSTVEYLTGIDDKAKTTNELLKELLVATLNGGGNQSISTKNIQDFLSSNPGMSAQQIANAATKFGVSKDQLVSAGISSSAINQYTGGATVTDKQIVDFVNANINNPMAIYNKARENGISSSRLSSVTGISQAEIDKFVRDNRLPSFAKGTDFVARGGLAMVHRAEAIVPSSTTDEIKKLREELAQLRQEQNQQTGDLIKVTDISNRQNAKLIADAMAQTESRKQWADRSKAALK